MRNAVVMLFSIGFICACSAPVGPIAGGALEGEPANWPDEWSFTDSTENVLLQTRPDDPYSVTIWTVTSGENIYVAAVDQKSKWVKNIEQNPNVIISIEGKLYDARAIVVTGTEESKLVSQAYLEKYEFDSAESFDEEDGIVFRLNRP
jgi:hypothetical protein